MPVSMYRRICQSVLALMFRGNTREALPKLQLSMVMGVGCTLWVLAVFNVAGAVGLWSWPSKPNGKVVSILLLAAMLLANYIAVRSADLGMTCSAHAKATADVSRLAGTIFYAGSFVCFVGSFVLLVKARPNFW